MVKIGITLGDPSGIGPEIVAKALASGRFPADRLRLYGNRDNFVETAESMGLRKVLDTGMDFIDIKGDGIEYGMISAVSGRVSRESVERAAGDALRGVTDGICTAPINKESFLLGGSRYKDHTDLLAAITGSSMAVTVFEVERLRILFLSKHVSLREACDLVTKENVYRYIQLADLSLRLLGNERRRIAVAALNPHGGEHGLFGSEEDDEITPAITEATKHYQVSGPFPADSVFHRAAEGAFDIVLSMYHDQGHIAAKMLDFDKTVSMNLGLPFLRTSVDHGTAFDIAGKGVADERSMTEAIEKCLEYSIIYRENRNFIDGS